MADFQVTGNIRIPNAAAILMRNQNDNADFTALSSDASANLLIGHANMPRITFVTGPIIDAPVLNVATSLSTGGNPAASGTIRLSNADTITARSPQSPFVMTLMAFGDSDEWELGDALMPKVTIHTNVDMPEKQLSILTGVTTSTQALLIGGGAGTLHVDTTNNFLGTVGDLKIRDNAKFLSWGAGDDVKLFRDGPWELALRDGTNDNFFYVYGTFTDSSNYERLALYAGTAVDHFLEPQSAGTGNDNIGLTVRQLGIETLTLGPATIVAGQQTHIRGDRKRTFLGVGNAEVDYTTARQVTGALSGASFTFTNIIPAGVLVKAVLTKVTTAITGATGYDVGDGTDVDRWAANVLPNLSQGSDVSRYTDPAEAPHYTQSQEDVVITALTSDFTGGEVTCIVIYERIAHNNIL